MDCADPGRSHSNAMENFAAGTARRNQDLRREQDHSGVCVCVMGKLTLKLLRGCQASNVEKSAQVSIRNWLAGSMRCEAGGNDADFG